jgi:hypothetical protein
VLLYLCSDHLKHTGPDVESGLIVLGGAMLEEPIKEGVPPKMKGSVLMCVADTEEEVLERVKRDVYYEKGVWDKEKVSSCSFCLILWKALVRWVGGDWMEVEVMGHALGVWRAARYGDVHSSYCCKRWRS